MKQIVILLILSKLVSSWTLDKKYAYDDNEFWGSHYDVPWYMCSTIIAVALIEGNTRMGKTSLKSLDSLLISTIVTSSIKFSAGRVRPRHTDSPNDWFEIGNRSFPSGHVSSVTSLVTPFILEYRKDKPWVYALAFFPIHQMVGRVKYQAHWTSDVLAGVVIGAMSGYFAYYDVPIFLSLSENTKYVGLRYRF